MAVDPKIIMIAVEASRNEKIRKTVLGIILFALGLIMLIFTLYGGIQNGLLCILHNNKLNLEWKHYSKSISDVFKDIKGELSTDVKKEVYEFMPDFSANLSKALIRENTDDYTLILFDEDDMRIAYDVMGETAAELREIKSQAEFIQYVSGFDTTLSFSEILAPEFANDNGIDNLGHYSDPIRAFLYNRAMKKIPQYTYISEDVTIDEKKAKRQTLTVNDGYGTVKSVEYTCIGGDIYLPEFLAMYNVHQMQKNLIEVDESSASDLDKQIAETVGGIPDTEEELQKYLRQSWDNSINGKSAAEVDVFKTASLKAIIQNANLNGAAKVSMENTENKLSIQLETIDSDTWKRIFQIDEKLWDYVEQTKMTIEMALDAAQIPPEDRTISLDGIIQYTLFEYFNGLFEHPMGSTIQGILSQYGEISALHRHNGNDVVDKGLTLRGDKSSLVYSNLQANCGKVVTDAFVYDVWNMVDMDVDQSSKLYNRGAVTFAYIIDVRKFEKAYGFKFPDISGVVTDSGYVTLFVEYSCLDEVYFHTDDVGKHIPDSLEVGEPQDGKFREKYDSGEWQHSQDGDPHVGVKVQLSSGKTPKPTASKDDKKYSGLSAKTIGVEVNPRLWFRGLGLGENGEDLYNIAPITPK